MEVEEHRDRVRARGGRRAHEPLDRAAEGHDLRDARGVGRRPRVLEVHTRGGGAVVAEGDAVGVGHRDHVEDGARQERPRLVASAGEPADEALGGEGGRRLGRMHRGVHPHPLLARVGHRGVGQRVHHDAAALRRLADRFLPHERIARDRRAEAVDHADGVGVILGQPDGTHPRRRLNGEGLRLGCRRIGGHDARNALVGEAAVEAPDGRDDVGVARLRERHGERRAGGRVEPVDLEVPPPPEARAEAGIAVVVAHGGGDPPRAARGGHHHARRVDVHRFAGERADDRGRDRGPQGRRQRRDHQDRAASRAEPSHAAEVHEFTARGSREKSRCRRTLPYPKPTPPRSVLQAWPSRSPSPG